MVNRQDELHNDQAVEDKKIRGMYELEDRIEKENVIFEIKVG